MTPPRLRGFLLAALIALPSASIAQSMGRDQWLDRMSTALPTAFCTPQSYFRQCFRVSARECEDAAVSAARICLNRHANEIPTSMVMPRDGEHWGRIVGQCAGVATEGAMLKQRISNAKCNDPAQWK